MSGTGLEFVFAQVCDTAYFAFWRSGHAYIAPMQQDPVMGINQKRFGYHSQEPLFNVKHCFPRRNSRTV